MNFAELGGTWEGRVVDGRLPLRQWLGGSDHSSVFLTEIAGPESPRAVVKIFSADFFEPERQLSRWRAASQLDHSALLRLLDGGRAEIDDTPFFFAVMDFVEEDLAQILPQRPLTADEVKDLLPPVLDGLAYLHEQGFVHGHLKPSNIMASGSQLKLPLDRIYAIGESRNSNNKERASVYDAPEVMSAPVSQAADVWSLGITLIAALNQQPPVYEEGQPPQIPGGIPEPLASIIRDCLNPEPEKRCTIAQIKDRLAGRSAMAPVVQAPVVQRREAVVPEKPEKREAFAPEKTPGPHWRILAPIAVVVIIGVLVLGQKIFGHRDETSAAPATETEQPAAAGTADPQPTKNSPSPIAATKTDSPGKVLRQIVPEVPAGARRTIHGRIKVGVQVQVDSSGKVTSTRLVTPGSSHYFANLAEKSAQRWEFAPPQSRGEPVASAWMLRFQFGRGTTQVFPAQMK